MVNAHAQHPAALSNLSTCLLSPNRMLVSSLIVAAPEHDGSCSRPVLLDVGAATVGVVATFSPGSLSAPSGYAKLNQLGTMLVHASGPSSRVRAVVFGNGARCSRHSNPPLLEWLSHGRAHCIEGPNVGARESHSAWRFLSLFYHYLPRAVLFVQDDPILGPIRESLKRDAWIEALENGVAQRVALGEDKAAGRVSEPWMPTPCACSPVREAFGVNAYGGYSPMHWWMRSFLAVFANGSTALPSRIVWPATAQFMLSRTAILR